MRRFLFALVIAAAALGLYLGWRHFYFLCDDAFIEYRYVSNSLLGWGYTWNPPPFRPVEGYTSFLWVALLDGVWRVFGIEPPRAANPLSLLFACGTLALTILMMLRLPLAERLERWRPLLMFLALVWILTNRTFLAWTSSGLETALFNFCFTAWVATLLLAPENLWLASSTAALLALTRPDGLLAVGASALLCVRKPRAALPLLAVAAHIGWRRFNYGAWLPNTYYAKHVAPWPASGARYLGSFILEYALWVWIAVLLVAIFRRGERPRRATLLMLAVVLAYFLYYTFNVGGDHFEYRIYSVLIPFMSIAFLWALNRLQLRPATAAASFALAILLSWPVPWIHWRETHWIPMYAPTWRLRRAVEPHLPSWAQFYGRGFDRLQFWLIEHYVCMRHQEHRNFYDGQAAYHVKREQGERVSTEGNPIFLGTAVGVPGWVLPRMAILDSFGLNDYVIARTVGPPRKDRTMAHDRAPPPGYLACFQPNVAVKPDRVIVNPRQKPLGDHDIRRCEEKFRYDLERR